MTIKTTIFSHPSCISPTPFAFCWWRHYWLLVTSQMHYARQQFWLANAKSDIQHVRYRIYSQSYSLVWEIHILTHWGRATHICVGKLTIIASDNGLSPGRRQANIWTNARILLIGPLDTKFYEILIEIHTFPFTKMHLEWRLRSCVHFVSASMC